MPVAPLRVLLIDDHVLVRDGVRLLIQAGGFTVVGECGQGGPAVDRCLETGPDVAVVDPVGAEADRHGWPGLDRAGSGDGSGLVGVDLVRTLRTRVPRVPVLALTTSLDRRLVRELLGAGACGYLLKRIDSRRLLSALVAAADGRLSIDPAAAALVAQTAPTPVTTGLTPRERDVLGLVARGRTNKVIARELEISDGTVRVYLSEILAKLGASNRTEAAMIALRQGLVDLGGARPPAG